jgi:hypothetical protein
MLHVVQAYCFDNVREGTSSEVVGGSLVVMVALSCTDIKLVVGSTKARSGVGSTDVRSGAGISGQERGWPGPMKLVMGMATGSKGEDGGGRVVESPKPKLERCEVVSTIYSQEVSGHFINKKMFKDYSSTTNGTYFCRDKPQRRFLGARFLGRNVLILLVALRMTPNCMGLTQYRHKTKKISHRN